MIGSLALSFRTLAQSPKFTSIPVEEGALGEHYEYNITTDGWWFFAREIVMTDGELPDGIELEDFGNGTGKLSGTPEEAGSFFIELTVRRVSNHSQNDVQSFTLTIDKYEASVTLHDLNTTYDGDAHEVKVTTSPEGLDVEITYNESSAAPTDAGSYHVEATVDDDNYAGSATGTLVINKAPADVTVGTIRKSYNGNPQHATATTTPAGLDLSFTYNGSSEPPTNIGSYNVKATVNDKNYTGSGTGTLIIEEGAANVTLSALNTIYNGSQQSAKVTTSPPGLSVDVTYNGSPSAPIDAGSYTVKATITEPNYSGSATGTMVISKATASIALNNLTATYDGNPKAVAVTTTPDGLNVEVTYNGISAPPVDPGEYTVEAVIREANYKGQTSGKLTIKGGEPGGDNRPVITNLEKHALFYDQGDAGRPITESVIINDFDDTHIYSATIVIDKNYIDGEDRLEYNGSSEQITAEFIASEGTLVLSGMDTRSNYEVALANVLYSNSFMGETQVTQKRLKLTVSDSVNTSLPAHRDINIYVLPELNIVNAFTPNGDGVNDHWNFVNLEAYTIVAISVYNKHGQKVYSCIDRDCAWDGTHRGKELPADAYFYTIDLDNGKRKYEGVVTILR
ncbi:hypothetical protein C900_01983 [Fulvivirga imtechensis AK7]|uniref:MBG domain-containing protein n=2 Tax=Fulvivirga TaxID=396811 RepID=L8JUS2_9BACT|nr:hypothetical protein C900_01983 [Fulvivirga imtechensis AK7]